MKVDKDQFDALLHKMMQAPPEPRSAIVTDGKAGKIIPGPRAHLPAQDLPSEPRKA
jgi:hypothetical protein